MCMCTPHTHMCPQTHEYACTPHTHTNTFKNNKLHINGRKWSQETPSYIPALEMVSHSSYLLQGPPQLNVLKDDIVQAYAKVTYQDLSHWLKQNKMPMKTVVPLCARALENLDKKDQHIDVSCSY